MEEQAAPAEDDRGKEPEPRPFSVVLAPAATVAVHKQRHDGYCGAAFIRHLPFLQQHHQDRCRQTTEQPCPRRPSRLSSIITAVRAQACALHFFRGRKLCRVVEFASPVADVAGLAPSPGSGQPPSILCVVVCRDGTAYALPTAEVLEATRGGGTHRQEDEAASKRVADGGGSGAPAGGVRKKSGLSSSSAAVGIFEDLAPTMLGEHSPSQQLPPRRQKHDNRDSGSGGGGVGGGGCLGGLVLQLQQRWAICTHVGARTIAVCNGGETAVAVAGIVDRAASYELLPASGSGGEPKTPAERHLGALDAVDGAAPTTSCVVWMEGGGGGSDVSFAGSGASGDGKGFPLTSQVFKALFGAPLARCGANPPLPRPSQPLPPTTKAAASSSDNKKASQPAVVLVGDAAGTVRWSPVRPHPLVSGGILASLGAPIVGTLPRLDAESRAIGIMVVGANGTVLSLTAGAAPRKVSRKRARSEAGADGDVNPEAQGGGAASAGEGELAEPVNSQTVRRCSLRLPFPVASACSTPGFLVHCYAGAVFASAVSTDGSTSTNRGMREGVAPCWGSLKGPRRRLGSSSDFFNESTSQGASAPLCPVRLPLPCDTVSVAVAPVLAEDVADAITADPSAAALRAVVMSLSARGRLVGFMAPRSAEELEGWGLDAGKGGVRVGGSAGVERRVRCQLERLSSVGRQCAALSAESLERDREIRTLREATGFLPQLAANAARRKQEGGSSKRDDLPALGHSVSMGPGVEETTGVGNSCGGTGQSDALCVLLRVRLWALDKSRATELPTAGEDGSGRWFVVTQIVANGGGGGSDAAVEEGWASSTSSLVPMSSLRQGWPWSTSAALTLPSARPVTVTSWLQFRFGEEHGNRESGGGSSGEAGGVCIKLGSSRFDILDWGVKLPSVPGSAAAVRRAAHGNGACFCGPELAIANILDGTPSRARFATGGGLEAGPSARLTASADWASFRLRLTSPGRDAGALLALLVPGWASPSPDRGSNSGGPGRGPVAELAVKVAGQVAVVRASDCAVVAASEGRGPVQAQVAGSRAIEFAVTCSHEAMAPIVREALLSRAGVLARPGSRGGEVGDAGVKDNTGEGVDFGARVIARGDAAARLVRGMHPMRQAVADASDAAGALGTARASDGPSVETSNEAVALMGRVAETYQAMRNQQEGVGSLL